MLIGLSFDELIRVLDVFEVGVMFCRLESSGRIVHTNAALQRILRRDSGRTKLEDVLECVLEEICSAGNGNGASSAGTGQPVERDLETSTATYHVRGSRLGTFAESPGVPVALVTVETHPIDPLHDDVLRNRFRLTRREVELTRLLVMGKRNSEVAEALAISPNTAHHYTERVLLKLGVRNRTEIGAKILLAHR